MSTDEHEHGVDATWETVVPEFESGTRIDLFLTARFEDQSRAALQRFIRLGYATVNGAARKPSDTLRAGDRVRLNLPPASADEMPALNLDLDVLYEDDDILVINKPSGLVVHPTRAHTDDTLVNALLARDPETFRAMMDEEQRPGIVHRLDKDTSGAMVVAQTPEAWQALKAAFAGRQVEKTYLTVVLGEFGAKTGRFDGPIGRHPVDRKKMTVVRSGGKAATTLYRVLGTTEGLSLLEVRILTGRTHQIRVHFSCEKHPVLGDPLYGGRQRGLPVRATRLMLHAWKLTIPHPADGVMRQHMAPPPDDFRQLLRDARLPDVGSRHELP